MTSITSRTPPRAGGSHRFPFTSKSQLMRLATPTKRKTSSAKEQCFFGAMLWSHWTGIANPFRWVGAVGYYYDEEVGTYYVRARTYDAVMARWLSQDPLFWPSNIYYSVTAIPLYLYVRSRPTFFADPSGLLKVSDACVADPDVPDADLGWKYLKVFVSGVVGFPAFSPGDTLKPGSIVTEITCQFERTLTRTYACSKGCGCGACKLTCKQLARMKRSVSITADIAADEVTFDFPVPKWFKGPEPGISVADFSDKASEAHARKVCKHIERRLKRGKTPKGFTIMNNKNGIAPASKTCGEPMPNNCTGNCP